MTEVTIAGQFLVATPIIASPPFDHSVVFVLEHDASGAIGVVINQATNLMVEEHLPGIGAIVSDPPTVFLGGPVSTDTALVIGRGRGFNFVRPSAIPGIGVVDIEEEMEGLDSLRVFAGYAGWEPDQLEGELEEGAWWLVFPDVDDLFAADVDNLWERTVERAPGTIPLYSTYPEDPSTN